MQFNLHNKKCTLRHICKYEDLLISSRAFQFYMRLTIKSICTHLCEFISFVYIFSYAQHQIMYQRRTIPFSISTRISLLNSTVPRIPLTLKMLSLQNSVYRYIFLFANSTKRANTYSTYIW